jgi:hypothetical protein
MEPLPRSAPRSLLSALPPAATPREHKVRAGRLALATLGSLAAAVAMRCFTGTLPLALWIPSALLVAAAALLYHGQVGSQLIVRSVWWANLLLGFLISISGGSGERGPALVLALGCGSALLSMGRLGLEDDGASAFRPVAFRTTLTLGMIMAVADAQGLTLFGAISLGEGSRSLPHSVLLLGSAAWLGLAIVGLYRLRVWGLLLAALGAGIVGVLAATGSYGIHGVLAAAITVTSTVQVLLPIPIVIAIARRRAPAPRPLSRLLRALPAAIVGSMMLFAAVVVVLIGHDIVP